MGRKEVVQDVEKLHQSRWYVFRHGQIRCQRKRRSNSSKETRSKGSGERSTGGRLPDPKKSCGHRINIGNVVLVEFAICVDENAALPHLIGFHIVSNHIMCKVVKDLKR